MSEQLIGFFARRGGVKSRFLSKSALEQGIYPRFSIVSRGTERRHVRESFFHKNDHELGYMNVFDMDGTLGVAPEPHGCSMRDPARIIWAWEDQSISEIALARFQLMTAMSLTPVLSLGLSDFSSVLVIGTGAVGLGALTELLRQGVPEVDVLSRRDSGRVALPRGAHLIRETTRTYSLVVDAVGSNFQLAIERSRQKGVIGLLASPSSSYLVNANLLHRKGVSLMGLHELVDYNHEQYQNTFWEIASWIRSSLDKDFLERSICELAPWEYSNFLYDKERKTIGVIKW